MKKRYLLTILVSLAAFSVRSQVLINEYSTSNLDQFVDGFGKYEDWIELYNAGGSPVSLTGYYLSDDTVSNTKWQIPSGATIGANGFFRVWADGRNLVSGSQFHTNFKMTQTKDEFVVLSDPSGAIIDWLEMTQYTQKGHSIGRTTNGAPTWSIFTSPTPNASNTTTAYPAYADKPSVSIPAGFYTGSVTVVLATNEPNSTIRYTLDGTLPTLSSAAYGIPITINNTSVLKAVTFSNNPQILPSFIEFDTYFINVSHTLRVISIGGTQLDNLANGNSSLEPFGSLEYFDQAQQRKAKTYGEFNSHGQDSWANSQRSLDFISRDECGYNHSIKEQMFSMTTRDRFQRIILRAAGDDNYPADHHTANLGSAHVRDAYIHNLSKRGNLDLDVRLSEKCIVYLNGDYWGVYDIREKPDDHDYTEHYFGQDKYNIQFILIWGNTWAEYGGQQALNDWATLYNYIMSNSMADTAKFNYVMSQYDGYSLIDYVLVNSFTVCSDWLNWNTGWWRGLDTTGGHRRWGYILWDNDATFDHYINYTGIPSTAPTALPCNPETLNGNSDPEDHIGVLNKLRQNPDFNQYYISRQIDMWNTVFSCDNMIPYLDSIVASIDPEMTQHANRWFGTYTEWQTNVQTLRNFIIARCAALSQGFITCYNLTGPYNLTINADPVGSGSVKLNSLVHDSLPWTGVYFGGMDSKLEAMPNQNFLFTNWTASTQVFNPNATTAKSTVSLNGTDSITAHFSLSTLIPEAVDQLPAVGVYPSVFTEEALVSFNLPYTAPVGIRLFSIDGRAITEIASPGTPLQPGQYSVRLNLHASSLSAGLYLVEFTAGDFHKTIKVYYSPVK